TPTPTETTPTPTETTPTPTETETGGPAGDEVVIGGGAVVVPVPAGWEAFPGESGNVVHLFSDEGDWFFVLVDAPEGGAQTNPAASVSQLADLVLNAENGYSNIELTEAVPQEVSGALVGRADIGYSATWTGNQGGLDVEGALVAAIRQDGLRLSLVVETPRGQFEAHEPLWLPIWEGVIGSFNPV
ncbi:MAG: hypothetical protein HY658_02590, partial [Actinobacteria bacterium]|nr:hypothetical protein [Actinomycetota bacterium]